MKIHRIINNNVVSTYDENGLEIVVMGKGVGFHAKPGQPIAESKIEKIFRIDSIKELDRFKSLLTHLPSQHLELANEIIDYAKEKLGKELNQNVYITLTDHISFAIERYREQMTFSNALFAEIKRFYYSEFAIGKYSLDLIHKKTGICLPEHEAASIALHLVNAEYNTQIRDVMDILQMIQDILDKAALDYQIIYEEDSLDYDRFVSHLKYLGQRLFRESPPPGQSFDMGLQNFVKQEYSSYYICAEEMNRMVSKKYGKKMVEEEIIYLTLHLKRIVDNSKQKRKEVNAMGFLDHFKKKAAPIIITAPVEGRLVSIQEVADPTFSDEILGKGAAIIPSRGKVTAPVKGTVAVMFDTGHAVSLESEDGVQILIHVGLDTVQLKGEGYQVHVKNGDPVEKGDLLIEFDIKKIREAGYDPITPIIICNTGDYESVIAESGREVTEDQTIITITRK